LAAYLIVNIDVHDPVAYEDYKRQVPPFIRKHGGEYLVRGGAHEVLEGDWQMKRVVVLRFPDRAAVHAFMDDPEYLPVMQLRHRIAHTDMVMVEGV
jgi:uncharacterized protein (DUF1330 family)